MVRDRATDVPVWLRWALWSLAIGLAVGGVVVAVVSSSVWPLIAFAGLAVPLLPVGASRTTRRVAPQSTVPH